MQTTTSTTTTAPADTERDAILTALRAWIAQRPGLDFRDYGDVSAYRAESRSITTDRHHAEALLAYVATFRSIDAERLKAAFRDAYSGRLTLNEYPFSARTRAKNPATGFYLDYCTGQYWPTEYRRAACAVLASAIWDWWRDNASPVAWRCESWHTADSKILRTTLYPQATEAEALARLENLGGRDWGCITPLFACYSGERMPMGDYLRAKARREFGASIARRWFN